MSVQKSVFQDPERQCLLDKEEDQEEKMATFIQQFKALMYKHILYKKRNKGQLIQEIVYPIYFVGILAMIKAFLPLDPQPAIPSFPLVRPENFTLEYTDKILVCPNDSITQAIARDAAGIFKQIMGLNATPSLEFYPDDVKMVAAFQEKYSQIKGFTGLQFNYNGANLSYAIRMRISDIGDTKTLTYYRTTNEQCRQGTGLDSSSCDVLKYMHSGFSMMQMAADTALMRHHTGVTTIQPLDLSFQLMPMDKYQPDTSYIQIISSLYFVLAYAQFVNFLTANIVNDKEKKIKEGMKMMGLRDSAYWASWAAVYFVLITVVTIVVTLIAYLAEFYKNSNMFLFFLILELYGLSLISFSWLITPFFQKAQTAGGLASLISMVTSLLYLAVSMTRTVTSTGEVTYTIPPVGRAFLSLISPCGVALAIDQSLFLDITVGMDFETIKSGDFPLYGYLLMLVLDAALYYMLAIYLDNIVPGNYGPRFPPYYIFMKSYWFQSKSSKYNSKADDTDLFFGNDVEHVTQETREKQGIRIYNITKEFPSKEKEKEKVKAVEDLSLEMYEGQITCLLGHNGAGKTTLLNMLSGLVPPSTGTAIVQGYDVSNPSDVVRMRAITGVCPQHDILFDVLTCVEHLTFYAGLKGITGDELKKRINQTIKDVGLEDQKDTFAKDLSGGQKRKLSVAISLIGDPKIIYLDEPTAGMDPYSRRHLWNVLKEKKKNRLILLTTHFMDEADILADRKAFISKGKLRCCGSSLFLKSRFGIGYHLNMVVEPNCKESNVTDFVRGHVEGAEFTRVHGKELSYTLPLNQHHTGVTTIQPLDLSFQLMPMDKYQPDTSYIQIISSLYFVLAYAQFVNFLTANIVNDKEKKIKEGMKMMGLRDSAYWASWAAVYFVLITVVTIVVTLIAYLAEFYKNSNMFLFFLILELYGLSLISFSWLITPFFQKAQTAGGLASLISMVTSLLYLAVSMTRTVTSTGEVTYTIPPVGRAFLSLISPCGVALAIDQSLFLDITVGMDFETIKSGDFPLYGYLLMLVLDAALYYMLAIYLDNIVPGNYGPRFPPYYIFMKSYWFQSKSSKYNSKADDTDLFFGNDVEHVTQETREKQGIRIYNITKEFPSKEKEKEKVKAVEDLSLEMYEGQITCLLGHNGAGKTTLLNMLSGLVPPSTGTAIVQGYDVSNPSDVVRMRAITGVCPQHDILFDVLTCVEHLTFYAGLKGITGDELKKRINQTIKDVGLEDQKDTFAKDLSGGQKRKLSVAISLIGDPKIIYLDEPTAGMDPYSRRHLWNVLKEKKKNRLILLTTHFMDEADILADRKAFISKGKLRCCGSSLFLKSRFGIGYHLNMVVEPNCKESNVTDFVRGHVEGAEFTRVHGKELSYTLPLNQVSQFSALFSDMESTSGMSSKAESLGIKSYGVSMTSLEEVFMKLEEDDVSKKLNERTEPVIEDENGHFPHNRVSPLMVTDTCHTQVVIDTDLLDLEKQTENLSQRQFKAMVKMWILLNFRNKANLVFSLVLPVIFVIIGLVVNKTSSNVTYDSKPTPISLQGLPSYARSKFYPSAVPGLLLNNSDGSPTSSEWTSLINSFYYTDGFSDTSSLLSMAPHYAGMKVSKLQESGTPPKFDGAFTIFYNASATYSIPMLINALTNSILSLQANKTGSTAQVISTTNLPWTADSGQNRFNNGAFSSIILIGMAFIAVAPTFAVYMVKDRETKVRTQLRVAGVSFWMYWGTHLVVDIVKFSFPGILCVIVVLIIQLDSLSSAGAVGSLILLVLFYIPVAVLFSYFASYMFQKAVTAQQFILTIFIFLGLLPYTAVSMLDMFALENIARALHIVFSIIDPPYIIFGGLYYIDKVYRVKTFYMLSTVDDADYFKMENNLVYTYLICLFDLVIISMLLRMLDIKHTGGDVKDAFPCHQQEITVPHTNTDIIDNEDEDVKAERERVKDIFNKNNISKPVAIAENLRKEFQKNKSQRKCCKKGQKDEIKTAVRNASFAVDDGEVFGLLGPNGAGKTTVINMIVAEIGPTRGRVVVGGHDIQSSMSEAFQVMGYCPQHDALEELMTLKEHLVLYATIRGVQEDRVNDLAEWFIEQLKVQEHANKRSKKLSGGTKRKLSYAISMLGKPRIVLLDEPSTGMDPASKRFLWDTITNSFQNKDRGAILTTHYMEEADALCSRVGIMVNGKLECLGPTQHLKNKYGSGYILEVKLKAGIAHETQDSVEQRMNTLEEYVFSMFPDGVIVERFGLRAQYKIPRNNVKSLAHVFSSLEEGKRTHDMEEYNFSQSSLEQVFLEFAKRQLDENVTDENVDNEQNSLEQSLRRRTSSRDQGRNSSQGSGNVV